MSIEQLEQLQEQNAKDLDLIYIGPAINEISDLVEKIAEKLPVDYHIKVVFSNDDETRMGSIKVVKSFAGQLPRLDLEKHLAWDGKEYMVVRAHEEA